MDKILIGGIFFSLFSLGFSQSDIYVGINAAPSITYPNSVPAFADLKEEINYSIGIDGLFFFNNQVFARTGINYIRKSFSMNGIPDTRGTLVNEDGVVIYDINDPGAILDPSRIELLEITEAFHSITVPFVLNYKFSDEERGALFISGGLEAGYIFNVKGWINSGDNDELTWSTAMNDWAASITAGFGWYQPLGERFLLIINPKYSYDFYPDWSRAHFNFQTISLSAECYFH